MAEYNFREIEPRWQQFWEQNQTFRAEIDTTRPKYYVLDMFPYPSGAGLHVGHPLGYIASDIVTRHKRQKGFNVLHPMGFDAFGLPAEQYAIQTGQHPAITTEQNIQRYKEQLRNLGLSYDWSKEVRTSEPSYYKWTQWIFLQIFKSWFNKETGKAEPIETLISKFEKDGNHRVQAETGEAEIPLFSAADWKAMTSEMQQQVLLDYRLAYLADTFVNWCPALGTVLANEEVKDGVSERGGYPVERKKMPQWSLRISAYADRLLTGLDEIDWPEAVKEMQRNWIGRSVGAEVNFELEEGALPAGTHHDDNQIKVFTTRPDTIFGASFLVLAPEHELVNKIATHEYRDQVRAYVEMAKNRSERDRMADVKTITGQFTGAHVLHPFTGAKVPVWIADYVLAGYGTGAVMAVPGHDTRDHAFAKHFSLPILEVVAGGNVIDEAYDAKEGTLVNSGFLNGLDVKDAIPAAIAELEKIGRGWGKINFRLRDAISSRQRYWGEPIPIYYVNGLPQPVPENELPLLLPDVDKYLPTETGEPPLGRAENWLYEGQHPYELSTMPGWAGSSWYYLRYMDPQNDSRLVSEEAEAYWGTVDLYMGGAEHATGHLLYARFWYEFLKDRGYVTHKAPFQKLINQGMIQGRSNFVYLFTAGIRVNPNEGTEIIKWDNILRNLRPMYLSKSLFELMGKGGIEQLRESTNFDKVIIEQLPESLAEEFYSDIYQRLMYSGITQHVDVNIVHNDVLDEEAFKNWRSENQNAIFFKEEDGRYICGAEVEKMSKSKWNVVNPDDIITHYGADTLRLYEMFLGPIEQAKPWNTNGIEGVSKFLRKFWRLFHNEQGEWAVTDEAPTPAELKTLHKTIKKVEEDIANFSFNTSVSAFMICVNELGALGTRKRVILEPLTQVLASYAPHISEELWRLLGHQNSISSAPYPQFEEKYLTEDSFEYPISVNGKTKHKLRFSTSANPAEIEQAVLQHEEMQRFFDGKQPKKVIIVPNKIVNVVI